MICKHEEVTTYYQIRDVSDNSEWCLGNCDECNIYRVHRLGDNLIKEFDGFQRMNRFFSLGAHIVGVFKMHTDSRQFAIAFPIISDQPPLMFKYKKTRAEIEEDISLFEGSSFGSKQDF